LSSTGGIEELVNDSIYNASEYEGPVRIVDLLHPGQVQTITTEIEKEYKIRCMTLWGENLSWLSYRKLTGDCVVKSV
jgi:hypothetical protein